MFHESNARIQEIEVLTQLKFNLGDRSCEISKSQEHDVNEKNIYRYIWL